MTREQKFLNALRDVFVGAKVEGESGFINLMRIKSRYFEKGVFPRLKQDIAEALKPFPDFREELFDKLYSFFHRYFSESGSIYFRYTPLHENVYERVYTDDRDVVLFWKTHMLYYVKTDRLFRSMEVEVDSLRFSFDVSTLEHKKANEKRSLTYDFKESRKGGVLVFTVAYSERGRVTRLNDILKAVRKEGLKLDEETLERAFRLFERQSEVDYFINKNARAFLREQFDLWVFQYVFSGETDWTQKRIRQLQALKDIAYKIIDFISQFEDELVKIWNKPKFVLNSNYVITLDRIAERDMGLVERILKHEGFKAQSAEWKELGITGNGFRKADIIETDLTGKRLNPKCEHLPIDTKHFKDLELDVLALFDNLDHQLDGWLIKSENYQALNTLGTRLRGKIQGIYLDPPYNAEATEILYENRFRHSTWATMMNDRLDRSKGLLSAQGVICVTIDDNEITRLQSSLEDVFGAENYLSTVAIRNNPSGRSTVKGFAVNHEYALFFARSADDARVGRFQHTKQQRERYAELGQSDGNPFEWENFRKNSTGSFRSDRPRQFYPIYYDRNSEMIRIPKMEWRDVDRSWAVLDLEQAEKMGGSEKNHSKCLEISVLWVLERSIEHLSRRHFE